MNEKHHTAQKPALSNEISPAAGDSGSMHRGGVATDAKMRNQRRESNNSLGNSGLAREQPTTVNQTHVVSRDKRMHSGRD